MHRLKRLLTAKIAITSVFWCLPLLVFPSAWFIELGLPAVEPLLFAHLLGAAYLALLVGYAVGLRSIQRGEIPFTVIYMGIASNGLASGFLLFFGATGNWTDWENGARIFMWLSAAGALSVALRLIGFLRASGNRRHGVPAA